MASLQKAAKKLQRAAKVKQMKATKNAKRDHERNRISAKKKNA